MANDAGAIPEHLTKECTDFINEYDEFQCFRVHIPSIVSTSCGDVTAETLGTARFCFGNSSASTIGYELTSLEYYQ